MRRLSANRDLFEASPGEKIIATVEAVRTPFQATFSDLESGGQWTLIQSPAPSKPVEKRQFTMPGGTREFFAIVYAFPPAGQTNSDAKYRVTFAGAGGTSDGPNEVLPPVAGDTEELPYEFRLPAASPGITP